MMNYVTQNNIYFKNYLNLFEIVPERMGGTQELAIAIYDYCAFLEKNTYFLLTVITNSSFFVATSHTSLSLSSKLRFLTISIGSVVLNELELGLCIFTLDSNLNIYNYTSFCLI